MASATADSFVLKPVSTGSADPLERGLPANTGAAVYQAYRIIILRGKPRFHRVARRAECITCAQWLLTALWITCSLIPKPYTNRGLQPAD